MYRHTLFSDKHKYVPRTNLFPTTLADILYCCPSDTYFSDKHYDHLIN